MMSVFLVMYTLHCTWVTSEAYSSPSIVLSARGHDGSRIIFDDFREAYYWLRHNTPEVSFDPSAKLNGNSLFIKIFKDLLKFFIFNSKGGLVSGFEGYFG